ncbi:MAG: LamG domain-containing protein, partial [Nitrospirae bacterium]|nr:LamG domain-containing protein [Nitrospirota bacterium]
TAGFFLASCGAGPQTKVTEPEKGTYALQFTGVEYVRADITQGQGSSLNTTPVTIEAWVKTTTILLKTIFARGSATGAVLFIDDGTNCATAGMAAFSDGDTVACSDAVINDGAWHHVAGVISNSNHSIGTTHAECASGAGRTSIPHIDLYVDGSFQDCNPPSSGTYPAGIDNGTNATAANPDGVTPPAGTNPGDFVGTIDEVRIWGTARTEGEIQQCRTQELSVSGGTCGIDSAIIHGYWKLNEGTGLKATDASGHGIDGSKYLTAGGDWDGGWVAGYPF